MYCGGIGNDRSACRGKNVQQGLVKIDNVVLKIFLDVIFSEKMGPYCYRIVNCRNNSRNSQCKFYVLFKAAQKLHQRFKWITFGREKSE